MVNIATLAIISQTEICINKVQNLLVCWSFWSFWLLVSMGLVAESQTWFAGGSVYRLVKPKLIGSQFLN